MKKLMIAAAAAAMIGGAYAADGYDFTATLKTTKGKTSAKVVKTYYLGKDDTGKFWYDDTSIAPYSSFSAANKTNKVIEVGMPAVPCLVTDKDGYLADPVDNDKVIALSDKYDIPSAGKWCQIVKTVDAGCYRIAGSQKISTSLWTTNCCTVAYTNGPTAKITPSFTYRFGALTSDKANKVESVATVAKVPTTSASEFNGWLAGQGTFANGRVQTLSGNIVGMLNNIGCENCCTTNTPARAFKCESSTIVTDKSAAFGSFRLKYNSKL